MEHPALTAAGLGYPVAIVRKGEKVPLHKNFPERHVGAAELEWYLRHGFNWGIVLRDLVVADLDGESPEIASWVRRWGLVSPFETTTRRGSHRYFRLPALTEDVRSRLHASGLPADILTGRRVAIGPGSVVAGHHYALADGAVIVAPETLPVFPAELLRWQREEVRATAAAVVAMPDGRAQRYVDRFEASVQGSHGSRALIVALLKILTLCGGDAARAWDLARYFNATKCSPPWDEEREDGPDSLKRKLQEALKFWNPPT